MRHDGRFIAFTHHTGSTPHTHFNSEDQHVVVHSVSLPTEQVDDSHDGDASSGSKSSKGLTVYTPSRPDLLVILSQSQTIVPFVYIPCSAFRFANTSIDRTMTSVGVEVLRLMPMRDRWPPAPADLKRVTDAIDQIANASFQQGRSRGANGDGTGDVNVTQLFVLVQVPTPSGFIVPDDGGASKLSNGAVIPPDSILTELVRPQGPTAFIDNSHYPLLRELQLRGSASAPGGFKVIPVRNNVEAAEHVRLILRHSIQLQSGNGIQQEATDDAKQEESRVPSIAAHKGGGELGLKAAVLRAGEILSKDARVPPERVEYALSNYSWTQLANMTKSELADALGRDLENPKTSAGSAEIRRIEHYADRLFRFFRGGAVDEQQELVRFSENQ